MAAQPPKSTQYYLWLAVAMAVIAALRLGFASGNLDIGIGVLALVIMAISLWRYWRLKRTAG
jgi:hypothetical protein